MFTPSQLDVRRFFCETWRKHQQRDILSPLESMALHWLQQHPEYEADVSDLEAALAADYSVERGQTNPFLHLSMHLTITEQLAIDQPPGIRAAWQKLAQKLDSEHEAQHQIMECLGQMVWQSQRTGLPPDGEQYMACVHSKC
ncbi:MAG: hypothetical protein RL748_2860 [Pseudomonadota bacterium]|jgi:hypothetical protein